MSNLPDPTLVGNSNDQNPMTNPPTSGPISNIGNVSNGQNQNPTLTSIVQPQPPLSSPQPASGGMQKEVEPPAPLESTTSSEPVSLEETMGEMELEPDLEQAGLQKVSETIDLPPDMVKMGAQTVGMTQPVATTTTVKLPINDDQIIIGLHMKIYSSLRWLAEWCLKKLKKAHIHLKKMGGKTIRETG